MATLPNGSVRRVRLGRMIAGLAFGLGLLAVALVGFIGFGAVGHAADEEKGVLASLISRALSTPASRVSIGNIEGALSSDATIRNIEIADRDGVWLKLDRARIVWRRLALLQRRLEIDTLEVDHIDVVRRPVPAETPVAGEEQPLLPELPVKVEVKKFALAQLGLGEPILGTAARVSAEGSAKLGAPAEGLDLKLDIRRLDQPGTAAVRLGLVPQGQRLSLSLAVDEPAGGIIARAANFPGLPPVTLKVGGDGTLDAFEAKLTFTAGPGIGANGTTTIRREGTARRVGLDLAAEIAGLLPAVASPVFAGTTRLVGTVVVADDNAVTIPGITLTAAAARLDVSGRLSNTQVADLRVTATNVPNGGRADTAVSGAEIRRLALDAHLVGALSAPTIDATLALEDARLPSGRIGKLDAGFKAVPTGPVTDVTTRIALSADARATGIALTDPSLDRAVGREADFTLRGTSTTAGVVDFDRVELKSPSLDAKFEGRAGSSEVRGRAVLSLPDLARFGELAGLALKGAATATADIEGTPRANRYGLTLDAHTTGFATGIPAVDGLLGGRLDLAGGLRLDPDGGLGFDNLRLAGPHADARLDGAATPARADVNARVTVPDLARADSRLSGRAEIVAHVTGTLEKPDATGRVTVTDAAALGRSIPRLAIDLDARDLRGAIDARLALDGQIDRKPARGTLHAARPAAGGTVVDGIDLTIGSVALKGGVTLDANNLAAGRVTLNARDLDDLSALALQKLSGAIDADVNLVGADGGQSATVKARAARIVAAGATLDRLDADLALTDIYRRPIVAGHVAIDELRVAGETIGRVRLDAQGTPQASDVTLTAAARGFDLDAKARVIPADRIRIELTQFGATRGRQRIGITSPATFTIQDGGVDIRNFALALGGGRLAVAGFAGTRLDLRATATAIPLATVEIVAPGLGLAGTFEGEANLAGTTSAPTGTYRARVGGLSVPQTREAGLPPIDVTAAGRLEGTRATVDATLNAGRAGTFRIGGAVPLGGAGNLDVTVRGNLDAGIANRTLGAAGRRVAGSVVVDARIAGTLAAPQASGSATLSGGTFQDAAQGIRLDGIRARLVARGQEVTIENAAATTRNGGTIAASGRVRLDPAGGFPGQIRVTGRNAQLVETPLFTAIAGLDLTLSGALARDPRIAGRVDIVSLDVTVPERLPSTLQPLPGTKHVRPTRTAAARLALENRGKGGRAAPAFDATLDLTIAAPGHITIHGRGLNAELGGRLRLTGTLAKPSPVGAFNLVSGRLQILTTRLDFTRANLTFAGDLSPELDFLASTQAGGAQIGIAITGPAADPQFAFTSSPDLPQDEILSRLLFGGPAGQLSAFQALALAQAAAQYSSGGDGAFENLRKSLGLSGLDIGLGANGPGLGLTRTIGNRVNIGVRAGASAADTGIGADIAITDRIKVQGEVGTNGGARVGVAAEYEW